MTGMAARSELGVRGCVARSVGEEKVFFQQGIRAKEGARRWGIVVNSAAARLQTAATVARTRHPAVWRAPPRVPRMQPTNARLLPWPALPPPPPLPPLAGQPCKLQQTCREELLLAHAPLHRVPQKTWRAAVQHLLGRAWARATAGVARSALRVPLAVHRGLAGALQQPLSAKSFWQLQGRHRELPPIVTAQPRLARGSCS